MKDGEVSEVEGAEVSEVDGTEVTEEDVLEVIEDREELEGAMRALFAEETRRVVSESFREVKLHDQERARKKRERDAEVRLRIAAQADALLRIEHERDEAQERLRARIDELVASVAALEKEREAAELRARAMQGAVQVAESMLAETERNAFDRGLERLRRTVRWSSVAFVAFASMLALAVLQDENVAAAVFRRAPILPVPSETTAEVEAVTGAARTWVSSAPAAKPTLAPIASASDTRVGNKPRLARSRSRAVIFRAPSSTGASPSASRDDAPRPIPRAGHDDDPLGGLDGL